LGGGFGLAVQNRDFCNQPSWRAAGGTKSFPFLFSPSPQKCSLKKLENDRKYVIFIDGPFVVLKGDAVASTTTIARKEFSCPIPPKKFT
jgi:hypothetical protein